MQEKSALMVAIKKQILAISAAPARRSGDVDQETLRPLG
jgi:hypothetical protein